MEEKTLIGGLSFLNTMSNYKEKEEYEQFRNDLSYCGCCGEKLGESMSAKCKSCEKIVCKNCYKLCKSCKKSVCLSCQEEANVNPNYCEDCGKEICFYCNKETEDTCDGCGRFLCDKHTEAEGEPSFFSSEIKIYCKDCA